MMEFQISNRLQQVESNKDTDSFGKMKMNCICHVTYTEPKVFIQMKKGTLSYSW